MKALIADLKPGYAKVLIQVSLSHAVYHFMECADWYAGSNKD